jgi:hypothetical protein
MLEGNNYELPFPITPAPTAPLLLRDLGKMFQNLRVSSPAPVTIEAPSGLIARYKTLNVWPVSVAIFSMEGYFQTIT